MTYVARAKNFVQIFKRKVKFKNIFLSGLNDKCCAWQENKEIVVQ